MRRPSLCSDTNTSSQMGSTAGRQQGGAAVFGAPLPESPQIPPVIVTVCTYIEKHGLAVSDLGRGDSGADKLRSLLERSPTCSLECCGTRPAAALAVLRSYLRELPEPLVSDVITRSLIQCINKKQNDRSECDQKLRSTLEKLPKNNFRVVEYLSNHLARLSLSPQQIGRTIGPSIFRMNEQSVQEDANNVLATIVQRRTRVFRQSRDFGGEVKERNTKSEERSLTNTAEDSPCGGRKRKESGGSAQSALDRKIIRSSSEERPGRGLGELRRVSSHGDVASQSAVNGGYGAGDKSSEGDKREAFQFTSSSKENVCPNREEQEETEHYHPPMDFSNLHGCEPVLSWSHVFTDPHEGVTLSPRSSFFISGEEESSYSAGADHSSPPSPPLSQQNLRRTQRDANDKQPPEVKRLTRKLKSLKRQLRDRQHIFEKEFGYRPSHADRITDSKMRELTNHVSRLRKELKHLKEVSSLSAMSPAAPTNAASEQSDAEMMDTFSHIQKLLQDSRLSDGRGECLENYCQEQVISEKQALQRALLMWERQHGRPTEKAARGIIRPLYDRYRMLKRMLLKSTSPKCKDELQPIIEHEETMSWQQSAKEDEEEEEEEEQTSSSTDSSLAKNYHEMTMEELSAEQKFCQEKKKELGRKIKEWEDAFQERSGRKAQKDDRKPMQSTYSSYKETKHSLRLLEALRRKMS